ncbi:MAG: GNAT family N-acetyltransferase [Gaiellaceae bacterium]|jgi:ribosomal protein S18 acetylase RimI-like enzyme
MKRSENSPLATISRASLRDAEAILALQKLAYQSEARSYDDWSLPPLTQDIASLREEFGTSVVLKATVAGRIVGSVRARVEDGTAFIGRLIVYPEFQHRGIGSVLLEAIEAACAGAARFELFTGSRSEATLRLYQRHGYTVTRTAPVTPALSLTFLEKRNLAASPPL